MDALRNDPVAGQAESLLTAIVTGDRSAFAALFSLYAPRIKGMLMARGAVGSAADDLTQEVMLAVWRKAAQFDGARGNASGWIFAITRNCLLNHLRGHRYAVWEPDDPALAGGAIIDGASTPDQVLAAEQDERAIGAALASLPVEQREVLQGAYFQERTLREVATAQRVPLGTVKTRVRLALQRLRHLLKAREGE